MNASHPTETQAQPLIELNGATLRGPHGPVYGPLQASLATPVSFAIGPHGSGRTSLLLTLAGRMHPTSGTVRTLGHDAVHEGRIVRRLTGIAGFAAIDQLEGAARVDEAIRERLIWASPWYSRVPKPSPQAVAERLTPVFGGAVAIPPADTLVRELDDAQDLLLRIALALIERPQLLLIDDIDQVSSPHWRQLVLGRCAALTGSAVSFVIGSADERDAQMLPGTVHDIVRLGSQPSGRHGAAATNLDEQLSAEA